MEKLTIYNTALYLPKLTDNQKRIIGESLNKKTYNIGYPYLAFVEIAEEYNTFKSMHDYLFNFTLVDFSTFMSLHFPEAQGAISQEKESKEVEEKFLKFDKELLKFIKGHSAIIDLPDGQRLYQLNLSLLEIDIDKGIFKELTRAL